MRIISFRLAFLLLLAACFGVASAHTQALSLKLNHSMARLDGPWLFHVGDNSGWADLGFDDSGWQSMSLSAPASATDGDVGLPHYAPGWTAKGYSGYYGYAWYRIHLNLQSSPGKPLALLGPWAVDSAYQVYVNGKLLGGVGDFSSSTPIAYGYHYPTFFELPATKSANESMVIAIRVWMGPWGAAAPGSGGIHIAPAIGERAPIAAQYHLQWLEIIEGYMVDAVPALMFLLAAAMALYLRTFERNDPVYIWLAAALLLSGILRGNQAFFFWWQIESIQVAVIFIALIGSLSMGAWMMAWWSWFRVAKPDWLPKAVAALTYALFVAQLLAYPWLYHAVTPYALGISVHYLIITIRLTFLLILTLIVIQGMRHRGREGWYALPAVLAIGLVLFTAEITALHVPGLWFPWGIGVSLSEYASVVSVLLLFILMLRRLWSYNLRPHPF